MDAANESEHKSITQVSPFETGKNNGIMECTIKLGMITVSGFIQISLQEKDSNKT